MTNKYTRVEYDCSSGVEKVVELTEEEILVINNNLEKFKLLEDEYEKALSEKENARKTAIAKLKALGLTELEINSLSVV